MDGKWIIIVSILCGTAISITGAIGFTVYRTKQTVQMFKAQKEEARMDERHREEMAWFPKSQQIEYDRLVNRAAQEKRALGMGADLGQPVAPKVQQDRKAT